MTNIEKFVEVFGFKIDDSENICNMLNCDSCPFNNSSGAGCMANAKAFWGGEYCPPTTDYEAIAEYDRGLNDAWDIAKKLALNALDGGADADELENAFGNTDWYDILENGKIEDLVNKYANYVDRKTIEVGDIVRHSSLVSDTEFLVLRVFDGGASMTCITRYGALYDDEPTKEYIGTGKRCEDFLNFRKGEDND